MALPVWFASIVQVPAPTIVTVEPDIVQTDVVAELNVTAKPDVLVAETENGGVPNVLPATVGNVIVCGPGVTANEAGTCGAAR